MLPIASPKSSKGPNFKQRKFNNFGEYHQNRPVSKFRRDASHKNSKVHNRYPDRHENTDKNFGDLQQ